MSIEELRERITNELVLHEGNVADWQWTRTGLPNEARDLGIADFFRLVDDVSRGLNAQFGKILDLQAAIKKVATDSQRRLSDVQIGGFALNGERLGLSRAFVTEQWVPRLVAQLPSEESAIGVDRMNNVPTPAPAPLSTLPTSGTSAKAVPVQSGTLAETEDTMKQKVRDILDDYKEHIPAQAIRALFRAITYDEKSLADAVLAHLTTNFYASETEPQGSTLREKLTSTDWRNLIWWERQQQAQKANVPPPASLAPSGTLPNPATLPVSTKSSGWRDLLVALLIAGGLIGFVVVLIRSNSASTTKPDKQQIDNEQVETPIHKQPAARKSELQRKRDAKAARKQREIEQAQADADNKTPATNLPDDQAGTPTKEYDELFNDVGQYGERPARKDGQWGLWRKGKWMVLPVYDKIDVFREGRAHVSVNGNSYDIDRSGNRVR